MKEITQKDIDKILNTPFWPPNLKCEAYTTTHDDNDGDITSGYVTVVISGDGDAWIHTHAEAFGSCRFRMPMSGGGNFPRIRNALLLLAEAIRQEGKWEKNNDSK